MYLALCIKQQQAFFHECLLEFFYYPARPLHHHFAGEQDFLNLRQFCQGANFLNAQAVKNKSPVTLPIPIAMRLQPMDNGEKTVWPHFDCHRQRLFHIKTILYPQKEIC